MASYSQPSYQQPYYGTPYQQPPPAPMMGGGYYGAPQGYPMPQAPVYQMDAASFRREFTTRLAELNVNSRPLIQGLSTLAHDHVRYGDIAAQCLEAHIRRVSVRAYQISLTAMPPLPLLRRRSCRLVCAAACRRQGHRQIGPCAERERYWIEYIHRLPTTWHKERERRESVKRYQLSTPLNCRRTRSSRWFCSPLLMPLVLSVVLIAD